MTNMDPAKSPSKSTGGGRRINNLPIVMGGCLLIVVAVALWYSIVHHRQLGNGATMGKPKIGGTLGDMNAVLDHAPGGPWTEAGVANEKGANPNLNEPSGAIIADAEKREKKDFGSQRTGTPKLTREQKDEQEYAAHLRKVEQDELESAVRAKTSIELPKSQESSAGSPKNSTAAPADNSSGNADLDALKIAIAKMQGGDAKADANGQNEKVAFMNKTENMGYLLHKREAPLSPYEIKTGTIIPAVMISGINSDLPGEIVGQVSQNVYDTATGKYLLIPQGTRLVGNYDNHVTYGQERALVVWRRIVFPDASTIDLDTMPGTDEAGYAGFHDQVDHHYWRIFGQALLVSAFTAGISLSQPQQSSVLANPSYSQEVTQSLGQQMGQLGMSMVQRNMDVQPTIKIRPGYRFTVLVNKDIILQPYSRMAALNPGRE
jgi:type IV secretory pathway VirB10-like protein